MLQPVGPTGGTSHPPGWRWSLAAALLSTATSLFLAFAPLVAEVSGSDRSVGSWPTSTATTLPSPQPQGTESRRWSSLVQREGAGIAAILAIPVLISLAPLLVPARRRRVPAFVAAVLLGLCVVVGAVSIGMFFLPSVVLMVVAAARLPRWSQTHAGAAAEGSLGRGTSA